MFPELKITRFITEADPFEFAASRAERGQNAGAETWSNAKAEAAERPLLSPEEIDQVRDYFGTFGAWDAEERAAWSADDVNALLIQFISGDLREAQSLCPGDGPGDVDWKRYEKLAHKGTVSGIMGEGTDGEIYIYLSN